MNELEEKILALTCDFIRRESVTPEDKGCQKLMVERLTASGFDTEWFPFEEVTNFWSKKSGSSDGPALLFAGHTDVVPSGNLESWKYPPFEPTLDGDTLYGRGAADMKGSLAAMLIATEQFVADYPEHKGSIAYLITSDEEGPFINGTVRVVEVMQARDERVDLCIVGEPSSREKVGDVIKNGRRGSLSGTLRLFGIQGHVAYPEYAKNIIHESLNALDELAQTIWDQGNDDFPPTSFQITHYESGSAENIIPGEAHAQFNFRYSTQQTADMLQQAVVDVLESHRLEYDLAWKLNGEPFITHRGELTDYASQAITTVCGYKPELSTAGGTSDGRFIAKMGCQIVELGPVNKTIHQVNENTSLSELTKLCRIYYEIMQQCLTNSGNQS